nr:proton-coupled amino acid transporter 4-like [Drosophila takahashii]
MGRTLEITGKQQEKEKNPNLEKNPNSDQEKGDPENGDPVRRRGHETSELEAATHLFKGSVGAGLFAMGDCFKNGGLAGATILLPIIAVMCVHCERMLIRGSVLAVERTPGVDFLDYPETVEKCFEHGPRPLRKMSRVMKLVVEMFLCVTQFGFYKQKENYQNYYKYHPLR